MVTVRSCFGRLVKSSTAQTFWLQVESTAVVVVEGSEEGREEVEERNEEERAPDRPKGSFQGENHWFTNGQS